MNCEYCYLKSRHHDGKHWEQEYGDCGCICNDGDGATTDIAVWNKHEPASSIMLIRDVKYCPFCGSRIMVADMLPEPPKDFRPEHLKRMGVTIVKGKEK